MNSMWKFLMLAGLGLLRQAGEMKKAEDANTTGKDDAQGIAMVFAAELVEALANGKPLPTVPAEYDQLAKQPGKKSGFAFVDKEKEKSPV